MKRIHALGIVLVSFLIFESFSNEVAVNLNTNGRNLSAEMLSNSLDQEPLYIVVSDYAVMFDGMEDTSKKISKLKKGITVQLLKKKNDWYKVKYQDLVGFVKKVHLYDSSTEVKPALDYDYEKINEER